MKVLFVTLTRHDEPLGIMYLSSVLKNQGHQVEGIMLEKEDVFEKMEKFKPDLVGYSAMTCEKVKILDINTKLKEKYKFFSIIGGPVTTFSHELIENRDVDAICVGEAEDAMREFVNALEKGQNIKNIKNIHIKVNGKLYKNEVMSTIKDIDSIPFPDRAIFKDFKSDSSYNILTSRGCPHNCTYCYNKNYKELYEGKGSVVRYRGVDNLIKEMKDIVEKYNPSIFWFQEDHFYYNLNTLKEFAAKYNEEINKPFICSSRPEFLTNEDRIKTLKEAGCKSVFTGCEAGNDRIRKDILKRNISKEQIITACDLLNKHNIEPVLFNMVGVPTSSFSDDIESIEVNIRCKPFYSWASICTPYPGTELFSIAKNANLISENYANELQETYHFKTSLKLSHANKVNIIHKIFALTVEYPALFPVIRQPGFYDEIDSNEIEALKVVFDEFKKYKYNQLFGQNPEVPEVVADFVSNM